MADGIHARAETWIEYLLTASAWRGEAGEKGRRAMVNAQGLARTSLRAVTNIDFVVESNDHGRGQPAAFRSSEVNLARRRYICGW